MKFNNPHQELKEDLQTAIANLGTQFWKQKEISTNFSAITWESFGYEHAMFFHVAKYHPVSGEWVCCGSTVVDGAQLDFTNARQ